MSAFDHGRDASRAVFFSVLPPAYRTRNLKRPAVGQDSGERFRSCYAHGAWRPGGKPQPSRRARGVRADAAFRRQRMRRICLGSAIGAVEWEATSTDISMISGGQPALSADGMPRDNASRCAASTSFHRGAGGGSLPASTPAADSVGRQARARSRAGLFRPGEWRDGRDRDRCNVVLGIHASPFMAGARPLDRRGRSRRRPCSPLRGPSAAGGRSRLYA